MIDKMNNISSFKSTIKASNREYKSKDDLMQYLYTMSKTFKWFGRHEVDQFWNTDNACEFFASDYSGRNQNSHLCGYILWFKKVSESYFVRSCFVEFHEKISFEDLTRLLLGSAVVVGEGGIGAAAGIGLGVVIETGVTAAAAGGTSCIAAGPLGVGIGGIVGGMLGVGAGPAHCALINKNHHQRRRKIQDQLGAGIYDAGADRINVHAMLEMVALHFLLKEQRYFICNDTNAVTIASLQMTSYSQTGAVAEQ